MRRRATRGTASTLPACDPQGATAPDPSLPEVQLQASQKLLAYTIQRPHAGGSQGKGYTAIDESTGHEFFVKVFSNAFGDAAGWQREVAALQRIRHASVARLYTHGTFEGYRFVVLDFVKGETLRDRLTSRRPSRAESLAIVERLADGLVAVAAEGIVHCDVKPENVLLPGPTTPVLVDFGSARLRAGDRTRGELRERNAGSALSLLDGGAPRTGTRGYSAPEVFLGEQNPAADVFSLGVVAYELLLGERPTEASSSVGTKVLDGLEERLRGADVPSRVRAAILGALAEVPERRPSAATFRDAMVPRASPVRWVALLLVVGVIVAGYGAWLGDLKPQHVLSCLLRRAPEGCEQLCRSQTLRGTGDVGCSVPRAEVLRARAAFLATPSSQWKDTGFALLRALKASCNAGHRAHCLDLYARQYHGFLDDEGEHSVRSFVRWRCRAGEDPALCGLAARFADKGTTEKKKEAVSLMLASCWLSDDGLGCADAAYAYLNGDGVDRDEPFSIVLFRAAAERYRRACDAGSSRLCKELGVLYLNGWGVQKDLAEARRVLLRACADGWRYGCEEAVNASLRKSTVDRVTAAEALHNACGFGVTKSCGLDPFVARAEARPEVEPTAAFPHRPHVATAALRTDGTRTFLDLVFTRRTGERALGGCPVVLACRPDQPCDTGLHVASFPVDGPLWSVEAERWLEGVAVRDQVELTDLPRGPLHLRLGYVDCTDAAPLGQTMLVGRVAASRE